MKKVIAIGVLLLAAIYFMWPTRKASVVSVPPPIVNGSDQPAIKAVPRTRVDARLPGSPPLKPTPPPPVYEESEFRREPDHELNHDKAEVGVSEEEKALNAQDSQ